MLLVNLNDVKGNLLTDSAVIANTFNEFFVNAAKNAAKCIPKTRQSPITYLGTRNEHSCFMTPAIPMEISDDPKIYNAFMIYDPN